MKKLLIAILLLCLTFTSSAQFGQKYLVGGQDFYQRYGVSPEGLVLWLDQSDPASYGDLSIWHDLSGEANHGSQGTGANQPAIVGAPGLNGAARKFDGSADFMNLSDTPFDFIDYNVASTLVVWFMVDHQFTAGESFISKHDKDTPFLGWGLHSSSVNDEIRLIYYAGGARLERKYTLTSYIDKWMCVCAVTTGANNIILYINGVNIGGTLTTGLAASVKNNLVLEIGARDGGTGEWFDGFMDVVMMLSRALTAAEVNKLHLAGLPRHGGI